MSGEVPIEIEDKPTAVIIMRELVEHLQDTIAALKREIVRNPKSDEYRKALKGTGERLTIAKQILAREEARASHSPYGVQHNRTATTYSGRFEPLRPFMTPSGPSASS
jgi:hypothetical protein